MNNKINRIISLTEIGVGLFMILAEISDLTTLPSINDNVWGGLELIKYKESTYSRILMWAMLLFGGISYFYNKKLYSLFTISFIFNLYLKYQADFYLTASGNGPITVYSLPLLATLICIVLVVMLFRNKSFIGINLSNMFIYSSILASFIWFIFYVLVEYFAIFNISVYG